MSKPLKGTNGPRKKQPNREIRRRVVRILESGQFREFARREIGVSSDLWARWLRDGRAEVRGVDSGELEKVGLCGKFVLEIEKAESRAHDRLFKSAIVRAGPDAQRWYLTKRFPEVYSGTSAAIVDDRSGEEFEVDPREILIEKLRALRDEA